jgi:predicted ATPase
MPIEIERPPIDTDSGTSSPFVFLSYASVDRSRTEAIAHALEEAGIRVWMDRSDIAGGEFWAAEIANAIQGCALLLVVCSPGSVSSRNVRQELQLAWDFDRPILPLMLEPVAFPPEVAYFLHGRQWIELDGVQDTAWLEQVNVALTGGALGRESSESTLPGARPLPARGRLPEPANPMIGRTGEMERILALLRDLQVRLVTISGPGGVGKTRLALALAREIQTVDRSAGAFVDLAPISDPELAPAAVAASIGVKDIGQRSMLDTLADVMKSGRWLLVLDNAEHLLGLAPFVAELLQACPSLTVLVTSRQPLHIRGEHEIHLDPLPVPQPGEREHLELLAGNEAVRLFTSRVQEIRADFELTADNAGDVAEICRQLDGLPLAIELAAPRIRMLSPAALRARLQDRLGLLTGGSRDAPARQQTLRRTIEWSYDLLSVPEQSVLAALSVFEGGFDLAAAEAVAGDGHDLLDELASLLEKSLLQRQEIPGGEPRFRMLESIRAFGLEQLEQSGSAATFRQRHYDYYLALAESLERLSMERPDPAWYPRSIALFDRELDNIRAAWRWRQQIGDSAGMLRLIASLRLFWIIRPYAIEITALLIDGLRDASNLPLRLRAMAELLISTMTGWLGSFEQALAAGERGLAAATEIGDPLMIGRAHVFIGAIYESAGDCVQSAESHREAVRWLRNVPDDIHLGVALGELGDRLLTCGDVNEAIPILDEALAFNRASAYGFALAIALGQRAHAARLAGDQTLAVQLFLESIDVAARVGDDRRVLGAMIGLAGVAQARGNPERAARLIGATEAARQARGVSRVIAHPIHNERILAEVRVALGDDRYAALVAEGRALAFEQALVLARTELGNGSG